MDEEVRIVKRCPFCGQRLFDKEATASGFIYVKCERCHQVVRIDLSLRRLRCPPRRLYPCRS